MANKSNKANKRRNKASNTEWLQENIERTLLDLEALSSMSIDDVQEELEVHQTASHTDFVRSLNERLPQDVNIKTTVAPKTKKRRKRSPSAKPAADRRAAKNPSTSRRRVFTFRNALVFSTLIIIAAILIPTLIKGIQNATPKTAVDPIVPDSVSNSFREPTRIEGSFDELKLKGVRYTAENFNPLVPEKAPLPPNLDSVETTLKFRVTVDSAGSIKHLVSLDINPHPIEEAVIDSVLLWRFEPVEENADSDSTTGILTITYFKEE